MLAAECLTESKTSIQQNMLVKDHLTLNVKSSNIVKMLHNNVGTSFWGFAKISGKKEVDCIMTETTQMELTLH